MTLPLVDWRTACPNDAATACCIDAATACCGSFHRAWPNTTSARLPGGLHPKWSGSPTGH